MNGAGAETGWVRCRRCIREISRNTLTRSEKARRAVTRSPMMQPQSRATDSAIAAKPCPVILTIGISHSSFGRLQCNPPAREDALCYQTGLAERCDAAMPHAGKSGT
jgi:hypothetical protein